MIISCVRAVRKFQIQFFQPLLVRNLFRESEENINERLHVAPGQRHRCRDGALGPGCSLLGDLGIVPSQTRLVVRLVYLEGRRCQGSADDKVELTYVLEGDFLKESPSPDSRPASFRSPGSF